MNRIQSCSLAVLAAISVHAGFVTPAASAWKLGRYASCTGDIVVVDIPAGRADTGNATLPFDFSQFKGRPFEATIRARGFRLSKPPETWLGFKFMGTFRCAEDGQNRYPGAPQKLGDFDWQTVRLVDTAAGVTRSPGLITLGIQAATGRVEKVVLDGVERTMGYVKLPAFYGTMDKRPNEPGYRSCSLDVAKWVAQFNTEGTDGMVLDLRGNGGGSLKEAVLLSALFVRPNPGPCPVVQIRETRNLYVLPTFPDQPTFAYRKPLVVLVDRHSASASEIVAGALQDTGRAVVCGDLQSHGKGTVQTVMPMGRSEFGSMKITTARFYRINGSSTQVKGVASDIRLPSVLDDRTDIGEGKLPNALPWSRIEPASYDLIWNMPSLVPELAARSEARRAKSPEWARRTQVMKLFRETSERRVVSLARDARKKQMKDDRAVLDEADEEAAFDDEDGEEEAVADDATARKKDIVLDEALNVLADLAALTKGAEAPEAPVQNNRIPAWLQLLQGGGEE